MALTATQITLVAQATTAVTLCAHPVGGIMDDTASYQWYRSASQGFTPGGGNILSGKTSRTLIDTGLTSNTIYYYVLRATSGMDTVDYPEFDVLTLGAAVGLPTLDSSSGMNDANNTLAGEATLNHTCGGTNRTLFVHLCAVVNPDNAKTATYNGLPMMPCGYSVMPGGFFLLTWKMVNPPLGTHAIVVNWSHVVGSYDVLVSATSWNATDTVDPHGRVAFASGSSTSAATTVDYSAGQLSLGFVYSNASATGDSGVSSVYSQNRGSSYFRVSSAEQSSVSWSLSSTSWAVSALTLNPVGGGNSYPRIPMIEYFEDRMVTGAAGQIAAAATAKAHWDINEDPNASDVTAITAELGTYSFYYAGTKVLYDIGDHLGVTTYDQGAADQLYVLDQAYMAPELYDFTVVRAFTDSPTVDYANTSDANDLVIVEGLRDTTSYYEDGAALGSASRIRENAYHLMHNINGDTVGLAARATKRSEVIANAKAHLEYFFDTLGWVGVDVQFSPFQIGICAEALIREHAVTGDIEVEPLVKMACDYLWNDSWHTDTLGMLYQLNDDATAPNDGPRYTYGSPNLNNLIAKMYAWLAVQTGDRAQMDRADWLFAGNAFNGYYVYGKQFNQAHWFTLGSTGTLAMREQFFDPPVVVVNRSGRLLRRFS